MNLFSFPKKSAEVDRTLILHIGSSSVVAAIVEGQHPRAKVVASVSTNITVLPEVGPEKFEREMEKALAAILASIAKTHLPVPDFIRVFLASPWYASQVRRARTSRPTSFVVTKDLLDDMISRELKAFSDEEMAASYNAGEPLRPVESLVVDIQLNGYHTANPTGMLARELELSLFLSVAPERTLKNIQDIIHKQYHKPVHFGTFLAASFIVTRDHFPHEDGYLLIDVGGEVTDVSLVRKGVLHSTVSFPLGRNFILRKLATGLKRSIPEAISICTLYGENKIEDKVKAQCDTILNGAKNEWLESFQKTLFAVSSQLSIPSTVMLSAADDIAPWFIETISREEFHQHSLTNTEFKVVLLDTRTFHESLSFAPSVPRSPCVIIETLAFLK